MIRRFLCTAVLLALLTACGTSASPTATPTAQMAAPSAAAPTAAPTSTATATDTLTDATPAGVGRSFIEALARDDVDAAEALEDETMRAAAPGAQLQQIWQSLVTEFGTFERVAAVDTASQPPHTVTTVEAVFADATVSLIVTVTAEGRVAGLHLGAVRPGGSATPAPDAAYVDPGAFEETDVTVGAAPWALPGTLSLPRRSGPLPAVVLLAGSGPNDRDETIGPNTPLRDIAWGLASSGISVLRYDKRTRVYASAMADETDLTVRQETTDDAVAAIALLRELPQIDPDRIFVVGHSLGGYLAPRIAARVPIPWTRESSRA